MAGEEQDRSLTVPHRRWHERSFVKAPLADLACGTHHLLPSPRMCGVMTQQTALLLQLQLPTLRVLVRTVSAGQPSAGCQLKHAGPSNVDNDTNEWMSLPY